MAANSEDYEGLLRESVLLGAANLDLAQEAPYRPVQGNGRNWHLRPRGVGLMYRCQIQTLQWNTLQFAVRSKHLHPRAAPTSVNIPIEPQCSDVKRRHDKTGKSHIENRNLMRRTRIAHDQAARRDRARVILRDGSS